MYSDYSYYLKDFSFKLNAFDHLGRPLIPQPREIYMSPNFYTTRAYHYFTNFYLSTLGDIDADGKLDILTPLNGNVGNVFFVKTEGSYNAKMAPWPMFRHDAQHTGCYEPKSGLLPPVDVTPIEGEVAPPPEPGP